MTAAIRFVYSSSILICLVFAGACQSFARPVSNSQTAKWTILIFMNADNNLEPDGLLNFNQLARVGSTDTINVIVQFDRIGIYAHTTPDWSQTLRFRVTRDMKPEPSAAVEDLGERNMGDPDVLADFVKWGMKQYPADHYMLVIWDHGQGWRKFLSSLLTRHRTLVKSRAIGLEDTLLSFREGSRLLREGSGIATPDGKEASFRSAPGAPYRSASNDQTDNDVLYNREIQDSLKGALDGKKLDVIGFDACLMSMVETMYALQDVGRYLVASEELEPARGWKYDNWLTSIIAAAPNDGFAMAKATVASYEAYYTDPDTLDPDTTLSAMDLEQSQKLAKSISDLSNSLTQKIDNQLQSIIEARSATSTYAPGYSFHHIDLAHFLEELKRRTSDPEVVKQIDAVLQNTALAVKANYAGLERQGSYGSNGIAIYFPHSQRAYTTDPYNEGGYEKDNKLYPVEFVQKELWSDFLHAYWSRVP
jgi:cysteine peptidase C11 family protein